MTEPNTELPTLAQEINAYLAEGWSGPRDKEVLARAASEVERLTAEVAQLRAGNAEYAKVFATWQELWNEREEWAQAAKDAWQRENVLSWLHAEAIWHATHHRAQVETQGLSHALLLNGFRGYTDQVEAMARKIREQDAELAALRGQQEPAKPCSCNGGWSVDENYQPEDYEAGQPLRPEKGLIPCGLCNHGGWDAPWPPVTKSEGAESEGADSGS